MTTITTRPRAMCSVFECISGLVHEALQEGQYKGKSQKV